MRALIFDTETSNLPEKNASIYDYAKWPYILQLSFILYDTVNLKATTIHDYIIKIPDDVEISEESVKIHGITRSLCKRKGVSIKIALEEFQDYLEKADVVIGHNIDFDKKMIMVETLRNKMTNKFISYGVPKSEYCTMKNNTGLCNIIREDKNGEKYFKYPTLTELYVRLFDEMPKNMHNSMADVLICLRCYMITQFKIDILKTKDKILKNVYKQQCT